MSWSGTVRLALASAVVLVWIGAPLVVVGALSRQVSETRLAGEEPAWVSVRPLSGEVEVGLGLALAWQEGPTVVAPAWAGLVEVLHLEEGQVLRSGDPVAVLDGVTRIAYAGDRPFSRLLQRGDRGADVAVLNGLLGDRALPHGSADRFDRRTEEGVRALAGELGAARTGVLDPAWMLHLTAPELVVSAIDLVVGAPAPAAGSAVVQGAASLTGAQVTSEEWAARAAVVARDPELGLGSAPRLPNAVELGSDARVVPSEAELRVRGTVVALTEDRGLVDDVGLGVLGSLVDVGAAAVEAVAATLPAAGSWAVPAAAVRVGTDGGTSVRVLRGARRDELAVEVVGASGPSTTVVLGDLLPSDQVEVPPGATAGP